MNPISYLVRQAFFNQIRSVTYTTKREEPTFPVLIEKVIIEFDGGTPSNNPKTGYGIGYGSYRIRGSKGVHFVKRISHGSPMSANAAEVRTLVSALRAVVRIYGNPANLSVHVIGDSKIALGYIRPNPKTGKGVTRELSEAVQMLAEALAGFSKYTTEWKARANSVALFGH